jgi:hypothetical protein
MQQARWILHSGFFFCLLSRPKNRDELILRNVGRLLPKCTELYNSSPPSAGWENKQNKKPTWRMQQARWVLHSGFLFCLFSIPGNRTLELKGVCWNLEWNSLGHNAQTRDVYTITVPGVEHKYDPNKYIGLKIIRNKFTNSYERNPLLSC